MTAQYACYVLPTDHPLAVAKQAHELGRAQRRKHIFANLPSFLAKYGIGDYYSHEECAISRDDGSICALSAKDKSPFFRPAGWSESHRPHRVKKYAQMRQDFKALNGPDIPENPMPSMSEPLLFSRGMCYSTTLTAIGGQVVLQVPYDADKSDGPLELPDGVDASKRITRARFMGMVEEYNSSLNGGAK